MGLHRAETSIAASPQQVWETVTGGEFSIWPGGLDVSFDPEGELSEGSKVHARIGLPGISGIVVSRVVECRPPYLLTTELVRTHHLPVSPDAAYTVIEGRKDGELTVVSLEIDIKFNGLKRIIGAALDGIMRQELQPSLDEMKANFEKVHKT